MVAVLPWLHDPNIPHLMLNHSPLILLLFPLPLNHALPPLVKLHKPHILRILQPLPNMECQRQVIEHILSDERVVLSEVVEEGFFVAEVFEKQKRTANAKPRLKN